MNWAFPKCPSPPFENYEFPTKGVKLDLGCANRVAEGFTGVDWTSPKAAVRCNLDEPLPFEDDSVVYLRACAVAEHLNHFFEFMDECWRVLSPGEMHHLLISVPRGDHYHAYADPQHKRFFHPNTFIYFTPYWHYETGQKPWEIVQICWCSEQEIKAIMKPIKSDVRLKELIAHRDAIRKEQGHDFVLFA